MGVERDGWDMMAVVRRCRASRFLVSVVGGFDMYAVFLLCVEIGD